MKWEELQDKKQFLALRDRTCLNNRIDTNCIALEEEIFFLIERRKAWFAMCAGNLYVITRRNDMDVLYYWVSNRENLYFEYDKTLICEIFDWDGRERQRHILNGLTEAGFTYYAKYYEWKGTEISGNQQRRIQLEYTTARDLEDAYRIYGDFDSVSDKLPLKEQFEKYYNGLESVFLRDNGQCVAYLLYKVNTYFLHEEWLYVSEEYRRQGYAEWMLQYMINRHRKTGAWVRVAWIKEENSSSIALHAAQGMKRTAKYKIVLVRKNGGGIL